MNYSVDNFLYNSIKTQLDWYINKQIGIIDLFISIEHFSKKDVDI